MPVLFGQVNPPSNVSAPDGSNVAMLQGKAGELINANLHGKFWTSTYRGRGFIASTAAAGVTIPISSATAPTFTLFNPIGSGVVAEIASIDIGITVVTSVASPLLLGYISGLIVAPTSVTTRAINASLLGGGGVAQCQLFTAATLAAAATTFYTIGHVTATNATAGNSVGPFFHYDGDGKIGLSPGSLVHVCGTAAQTSPTTITMSYIEWPL